jgi:hypothetical protein
MNKPDSPVISNGPDPSCHLLYDIGKIFQSAKEVFGQSDQNHAYRYMKLVEVSNEGFDCKYAKATSALWKSSGQEELTFKFLSELRDAIDDVLKQKVVLICKPDEVVHED